MLGRSFAEGDCGLCFWLDRYECDRLRGGLEGLETPGDGWAGGVYGICAVMISLAEDVVIGGQKGW